MPAHRVPVEQRLADGVVRMANGCLVWTGAKGRGGYGSIWRDGRTVITSRVAWELAYGPIPDGLVIRHFVCDNPPCCEPTHLRLGTPADNTADMLSKGRHSGRNQNTGKTHCLKDHPLSGENLYIHPSLGRRGCRKCLQLATARHRRKGKVS